MRIVQASIPKNWVNFWQYNPKCSIFEPRRQLHTSRSFEIYKLTERKKTLSEIQKIKLKNL